MDKKFRGFWIERNDKKRKETFVCLYFPKNLEKFFKNVELIIIQHLKLLEITQSDLKPFKELKYLSLENNNISCIERDLFKFNTELRVIKLNSNKIKYIFSAVLDHLVNLKYLWLNSNECIKANHNSYGDRDETLKLIEEVKKECSNDNKKETKRIQIFSRN